MKIIINHLLLICLCTTGLISQNFSVYKNTVSGGIINTSFVEGELELDDNDMLSSPYFVSMEYVNGILSPSSMTYEGSFIDITSLNDPKELMMMYHLTKAREYAISILGVAYPFESTENGMISISQITVVAEKLFNDPIIQTALFISDPMLEYSVPISASGNMTYEELAEDAYAIVRGYFTLIYKAMAADNPITGEGTDMGLGTYFAHRYMTQPSLNYNTDNEVHTHGGHGANPNAWETLTSDLYNFLTVDYYGNINLLSTDHKRSELLFASLWQIGEAVGHEKLEQLIVGSFTDLQDDGPVAKSQLDATLALYNNTHEVLVDPMSGAITVNNLYDFTDDDRCAMLDIFTDAYGIDFFDAVDPASIPSSSDGEIYIKDNAAHTGTEVTTGSYTNSPSIWNRHDENDFTPEHQNPYGGGAPTTTQYINIAIDGSFCDIQGLINIVGDVHYKIYRSVPKLGYEWPLDWDDENVHNVPEGDLIGTFYFRDPDPSSLYYNLPTFRNDIGEIVVGGSEFNYSNQGNALILSFPWEVPDYLYDIWLPNISPKDNSGLGFSFQDAFLVRVESSQYDPIANGEVANVYANVQNNNNIAMKTSNITIVYEQGSTGSTPGFLLPNDDDDPGDVVISVNPSTHDPVRPVHPDPTDPDGPFVPIHPEFNNYMDYGEVRIVLDEDTHQDWIANGTQGNGFIVNGDNEIVVRRSDFTLEGIPRSVRGGQIRAMGVRYYAANGTFTSRTGFDVVAKNSAGNIIGSTHFEVREDSGSSVPRSSAGDNVNGDITIYPNPINGNTLHLDNITREGSYTIMGVDGKTHAQGRYSKAQKSLDISILNKGIYFIRFANDEGVTETKQLIINN